MVIKVIAGQIGKDSNFEPQPITTVQVDGLGRSFHYPDLAALVYGLA